MIMYPTCCRLYHRVVHYMLKSTRERTCTEAIYQMRVQYARLETLGNKQLIDEFNVLLMDWYKHGGGPYPRVVLHDNQPAFGTLRIDTLLTTGIPVRILLCHMAKQRGLPIELIQLACLYF